MSIEIVHGLKDKLAESSFFLEQISKSSTEENAKNLPFYFSAFLSSTYSIFDYVLAEANYEFNVGLSSTEKWFPRDFRIRAEEIAKGGIGDKKALTFFEWWSSRKNLEDNSIVGNAFSKARNINTHKKPSYKLSIKIPNSEPSITEKGSISIEIKVKIELLIENLEHLDLQSACSTWYSTITKFVSDSQKKMREIKKPNN